MYSTVSTASSVNGSVMHAMNAVGEQPCINERAMAASSKHVFVFWYVSWSVNSVMEIELGYYRDQMEKKWTMDDRWMMDVMDG